jgi:hypothetical protein
MRGSRKVGCKPGQETRGYTCERQRLIGAKDALKRLSHREILM